MNSNPTRAICGISPHVNHLIEGIAPRLCLDCCGKLHQLTNKAEMCKSKLEPLTATRNVLAQVSRCHGQSQANPKLLGVLGLISLPAALVHDIVKPLSYPACMAVALWRRRKEKKRAQNEVVAEIIMSLTDSMEVVWKMLTRLGFETPEALRQQIDDSGYVLHLTLARLLEAYGSRFAPPGFIYLASGRWLCEEHCSGIARLHFNQIHNLKEGLISVGLLPETLSDSTAAIENWLPKVLQALKGTPVNKDDDPQLYFVLQKLHSIRDELAVLVLA